MTTLLAMAAASVAAIVLRGAERNWTVAAIWAIYLPIFVCGLVFIRMNFFCPAVCRGPGDKMKLALTFDDGPDPKSTPPLLELLAREKIAATFFCIGEKVAANPQLAARIAAEGHLLGNHSHRHPWYFSLLWGPFLKRELADAQRAIENAAGVAPIFFRPPMGMTSPPLSRVAREMKLTVIGWDVRSLDTVVPARKAVERIVKQAHGGSIIVLHDGGALASSLSEIAASAIKELRARGFLFERVDSLLADSKGTTPQESASASGE